MAKHSPKRRVPRPGPKPKTRSTTLAKRASPRPRTTTPLTKLDAIVAALRSPIGASIADLMQITSWQMHSVRGALAGALKKKRGLKIISSKTNGERIYRIEAKK